MRLYWHEIMENMMNNAIFNRRSIRKYKDIAISRDIIEDVIRAGMLAPSSKNRQPWKFVVVSGMAKEEMLSAMMKGLERERYEPLLPDSRQHLHGAEYTMNILCQSPVTIFILNTEGLSLSCPLTAEERIYEICNAQSIGAAIENMTLTATSLGLGSLWICDTYFAYRELCDWLDIEGELFGAMTLGYADEQPQPRPRKTLDEVVEWRNEP